MAEMNTKDLTTYLKYAADLESSIFRQEKAIEQAKKELNHYRMPTEKYVALPYNQSKSIKKPEKSAPVESKDNQILPIIILLIIGIASIIMGLCLQVIEMILVGVASSIAFFYYYTKYKKEKDDCEQKYNKAVRDYEEAVQNEEKYYQERLAAYEKEKAEAKEAYKRECAIMQPRLDSAKYAIQQMDTPLLKTKEALKKLYDTDIIFPKYRNMVAMCTMYEYFVTGRCTELTGPNGAYNLYEAELRQNLVINRLDTIITQLESIKENQYILYQEMSTTNRIVSDISSDIKNILSNTKTIAKASNISAHNSQVIAKNTEALKFITLISN